MYKKENVCNLLSKIEESLDIIIERSSEIKCVDDFLTSPAGTLLLDSICMKLIAIGESIKNLDKLSNRELLINYPQTQWKEVMGMRDIIVHHYFEIDADIIFATVNESVPELRDVIRIIKHDISLQY